MPIDYDSHDDWVTTQLRASRNVEHSLFNDWWSGHLNFQIEHQSVVHYHLVCLSHTACVAVWRSDSGIEHINEVTLLASYP